MFTARFWVLRITLASLLFAADVPGAWAEESKGDKIKELLKERLAVLQELTKLTTQDYQSGKVSIDRVQQARMSVLNARLELCETDKDRVAILEEGVTLAKESEKMTTALYQAGKVTASDPLVAKAARLEAEVALERAKAKSSAKPK